MNRSNITSTKDKMINLKVALNKLGAALIFPLSLLAFASMFMGIAYSLPTDLFVVTFTKGIVGSLFTFFPLLVFISLLNTYIDVKTETTILEGILFLLTILAVYYSVTSYFELDETVSLFTIMISSFVFVIIYKYNIYKFLWVPIGALLSLALIPIFILVNYLIETLGLVINILPIGLNSFTYGFVNRLLLPFGLHSIMIPTFTYTTVGGYLEVYDSMGELVKVVNGDSMIWMTLYSYGQSSFDKIGTLVMDDKLYTYKVINNDVVGQYQQGFLPVTTFMFPMVALLYCNKYGFEKGRLLMMGVLLTMFSGITETTEYCFILISPMFYLLNALMVGLSFMLCNLLQVHNWISTGWCIDIILFGLIPTFKGFQTHWYFIPLIGIMLGAIYSLLFILINERLENPINNN